MKKKLLTCLLNNLTRSMMLEFLRSLFLIQNLKIISFWVRIFFHKNALFFIDKFTKRFYLKQYLFDDSIYTNINYMIILYKASKKNQFANKRFNKKLSRVRINIEHIFEMLKERWQSLTRLRLIIRNKKQYRFAMQWIIVCVILHNILIKNSDVWNETNEWWNEDDQKTHVDELMLLNQQQLREETLKRDHIKEVILKRRND
jgi:hypothetical protein